MTVDEIRLALSREAKATLINFGDRMGAPMPRGTTADLVNELYQYGLITRGLGNLTVRGVMVRNHVLDVALDAL